MPDLCHLHLPLFQQEAPYALTSNPALLQEQGLISQNLQGPDIPVLAERAGADQCQAN